MVEIQHSGCFSDEKPRPVNDISLVLQDGSNHIRNFRRIVLQVGILNYDDVADGGGDSTFYRCSLSLVSFVPNATNLRMNAAEVGDYGRCGVLRAIVNDDYFQHTGQLQ